MKTLLPLFFLLPASALFAADECADKCAEKDGHGHAAAPKTLEELFAVKCECNVPQYTCDECRYELGLVKLDPSLIRAPGNSNGLVNVETVAKRPAQKLLHLTGEIALNESALTHVSPRVAGNVRAIKTDLGKQVKKGDVLFEIESPALGLAVGTYRKNAALAALALKNLEREQALADQKLSPQADVVEAQMKYDEYRVELESAKNALSVMGLDEAAIRALTADGTVGKPSVLPVKAPQSGTVIQKHLDPGEAVDTGKDVLTLADLASVWVWLSVYETDLAALTAEAKTRKPRVQITLSSAPGRVFEGEIDLIGTLMDENTRTVKVRAVLKNPDGLLRPGMFCDARVVFPTAENVVAVSKSALMSDEGKFFVFRLIRDGFALRTDVAVGREFADCVEITGGLPEGERIATQGAFLLKSDVLRSKMGAGCAD